MDKSIIINHLQVWYVDVMRLEEGGAFALAVGMEIERLYHLLTSREVSDGTIRSQVTSFLRNVGIIEREFRKSLPEQAEKERRELGSYVGSGNPNLIYMRR